MVAMFVHSLLSHAFLTISNAGVPSYLYCPIMPNSTSSLSHVPLALPCCHNILFFTSKDTPEGSGLTSFDANNWFVLVNFYHIIVSMFMFMVFSSLFYKTTHFSLICWILGNSTMKTSCILHTLHKQVSQFDQQKNNRPWFQVRVLLEIWKFFPMWRTLGQAWRQY